MPGGGYITEFVASIGPRARERIIGENDHGTAYAAEAPGGEMEEGGVGGRRPSAAIGKHHRRDASGAVD
jgi:hypothetical protein